MPRPYFSILIPTMNRPHLVRDAVQSVLLQDWSDFEIIVSNNGGDPETRSKLVEFLGDVRVRYIEQPTVLNMPDHWEAASRKADGRYLMILTDRSVLKKGALSRVAQAHKEHADNVSIVTWNWDHYYEDHGLYLETPTAGGTLTIDSTSLLRGQFSNQLYKRALPRGLNSCVSTTLVEKIRRRTGGAFLSLSPDYTFAYQCLLTSSCVTHVNQALMISQGLSLSSGALTAAGDRSYVRSVCGDNNPLTHVPLRLHLVINYIYEDYLSVLHRYGRTDLIEGFDRARYYRDVMSAIENSRAVGVAGFPSVRNVEAYVRSSLRAEGPEVILGVENSASTMQGVASRVLTCIRRATKAIAPGLTQVVMRARGARRVRSVLRASGFDVAVLDDNLE